MGQGHGKPTVKVYKEYFLIFFQPFEQITSLTDVAEGTIVRVITRLDETCREVRDAARVIGDAELFKKMEESQIKIKRDSGCFCSSNTQYLTKYQLFLQQACTSNNDFHSGIYHVTIFEARRSQCLRIFFRISLNGDTSKDQGRIPPSSFEARIRRAL